jgi:SPP1 gp7 family putative phage head morphogenesis protein
MDIKNIFQNTKETIKKLVKPGMGEMSSSGTDIWGIKNLPIYNPDDLVGKKGLDIYRTMQKRDGQVKAVFMLKKHARLSTPWSIRPEDENDQDAVKQAEFIEHCFSEMKGNINNSLLKIWNAMRDGYSVAEINYKIIPSGEFKGMIGIDNIKVRKAINYMFGCDEHGNIKEEGLIEAGNKLLPINKFIIFAYNPNDDDADSLYGESDFRAAYRYYFSNDIIQRFWNIFLEKFGQPTVIGRYVVGTPKIKQDEYLDILKNIQTDTAIVMPVGLEAELLEATRRGDAGYKEAFDTNNAMIARSLLVGTLLMDTGEKGSWALSKTHFDIFIYILDYLGNETEDTIIREQVIKRLIDFNFPQPKYPYFKFESLIKDDQKAKAEIAKMLVDAGLINQEEEWVRGFLKIPAKEEGIVLPEPKPQGLPFTENYQARGPELLTKLLRQPNQYEKKCNFTRIIKNLDNFEVKAKEELEEILIWQKDALKKSITKAKIMESQNAREVEKIQLHYVGEFRDCIGKWLQELFEYGMSEVESELKIKKFVGLPAEKALQYLKNKAFWIAGVTRDTILKDAKGILYTGMKNGSTTPEIMFLLDQFFKKFANPGVLEIKEGKLLTAQHLENIVRTNFSDAYNQGRQDMMEDPEVKDIMAGEMFSAIMDDRTTEICQALDGQIFIYGDPDIARFTPPLHYECRSQLIPVTIYETFEAIKPELKARALPMKGKDFINMEGDELYALQIS